MPRLLKHVAESGMPLLSANLGGRMITKTEWGIQRYRGLAVERISRDEAHGRISEGKSVFVVLKRLQEMPLGSALPAAHPCPIARWLARLPGRRLVKQYMDPDGIAYDLYKVGPPST